MGSPVNRRAHFRYCTNYLYTILEQVLLQTSVSYNSYIRSEKMKIKTSMCSVYSGEVCYYFLQQSAKWWRCRKPSKVRSLNRYSSCCVWGTAMKPVYTYASPHAEQLLPSNFWPLTFRSPTIRNNMKNSKNLSPPGFFSLRARNFFHMNFGPIRSDWSTRFLLKWNIIF